ncbi:hypothetical protein J4U00_gp141 [Mycobacterium phage DyoEdafos]|uniref:Uncharacterized protein n=1 Tax=Mycobacterium phage DyoEdafos TaxID=2599860 RepID=A0A5J6THT2_9CAUD|nr:hypothetical protein J4U00_gp141 [Mycobacterium phage DyoEdafos]QFG10340.1 hypothetical protein SEA_DYOEDAFOS_115 [Mycobacterium phage DyoEdafos]
MTDFEGRDPIKVAKDALGVVQELRDRAEWPKGEIPEQAKKPAKVGNA